MVASETVLWNQNPETTFIDIWSIKPDGSMWGPENIVLLRDHGARTTLLYLGAFRDMPNNAGNGKDQTHMVMEIRPELYCMPGISPGPCLL